jgi:hypothetical protein
MYATVRELAVSGCGLTQTINYYGYRLIPLDKCPGVRPIGVGEVPRRIISKAILSLFRLDIQEAVGPLQVCAGQEGGCEAAIHAMRHFFDDDKSHGVLLVDASNAFNTTQHQINLSTSYQVPIRYIVCGDGEITSSEGTTQGGNALAVRPLISKLQFDVPNVKRVWYALVLAHVKILEVIGIAYKCMVMVLVTTPMPLRLI